MNDKSGNLPFWGKQKPLRHYINHGLIKFTVKDGHLLFAVIMIEKERRAPLYIWEVKSKEHLERLLASKTLREVIA